MKKSRKQRIALFSIGKDETKTHLEIESKNIFITGVKATNLLARRVV
jgi:hypothetical protein